MKKSEVRKQLLVHPVIQQLTEKEVKAIIKLMVNKKNHSIIKVIDKFNKLIYSFPKVEEGIIDTNALNTAVSFVETFELNTPKGAVKFFIEHTTSEVSNFECIQDLLDYLFEEEDTMFHEYEVALNHLPDAFKDACYDSSLETIVSVMNNFLNIGNFDSPEEENAKLWDGYKKKEVAVTGDVEKQKECIKDSYKALEGLEHAVKSSYNYSAIEVDNNKLSIHVENMNKVDIIHININGEDIVINVNTLEVNHAKVAEEVVKEEVVEEESNLAKQIASYTNK